MIWLRRVGVLAAGFALIVGLLALDWQSAALGGVTLLWLLDDEP